MIVICGIGNQFRKDDGAGLKAVSKLEKYFLTYQCHSNPEDFVNEICAKRPEKIIIIDGADINEAPGTWRRIKSKEIDNHTLSTHRLPVSFFVHLLKECCGDIELYGIQVKDVQMGNKLSKEVIEGVNNLSSWLIQEYGKKI